MKQPNPVSWQVSAEGTRMIGHMIFKKNLDSEDKLGLKVIGGQVLSNGRLGAIVEKVKQGSIADQEGHIKPGMFRSIGVIITFTKMNSYAQRTFLNFPSSNNQCPQSSTSMSA